MKKEPESKTGTLKFEKIEEAVKEIFKDATEISFNFYNREGYDLIFKVNLNDEFDSSEFYRLNSVELNELIVKYLEKRNIKVKMNKENDYSSAHIYFDKNILKFRYL